MSLTAQILLSLGGGLALLFCLFLIASYAPEGISLFLVLGFLLVHSFIGTIIDKITGTSGFSSSPVMLVPPAHNSGMMPALIVVWLGLSVIAFIIIRISQRFFYS